MGSDIHQLNIIWDTVEGKYSFEGENKAFCEFGNGGKYETLAELVPWRSYLTFGILAGVRSFEYQIKTSHEGYPEAMGTMDEISKKMSDSFKDLHTPTWYYLPELETALEKTARKIKTDYKKAIKKFGGTFSEESEYFDNPVMLDACGRMLEELRKTKEKIPYVNYAKSIVLFVFDS